jgi:cell division protein FtsB
MSRLGRSLAWILPFALLVLSIVSVPLAILDDAGLPRYRALRGEVAEIERVNDRLRRDVRRLRAQVDGLRSDPATIERIARDDLGMIRREEILFQFSE